MTRKVRYGLLIAGFLFFISTAPILVLYVQGKLPSFKAKRALETGILSIVTNPRSSTIYLNGKVQDDKTPAAFRFLSPGNYEIKIEKPGFRPWIKNLSVFQGKVTHVNPEPERQILLKDSVARELSSGNLVDFVIKNNKIYSLDAGKSTVQVSTKEGTDFLETKIQSTPKNIFTDHNSKYIAVTTDSSIVFLNEKLEQVNEFVFNEALPISLPEMRSDHFFFIQDQKLKKLSITNTEGQAPEILAENTIAYGIFGEDAYLIQNNGSGSVFVHAKFIGSNLMSLQILTSSLPQLNEPKIFIDTSKAIFTLDNGILYRLNTDLEKIAEGVVLVKSNGGTLVYFMPGELWWYESSANRAHIISRRTDNYLDTYFQKELQYIFFSTSNELVALEVRAEGGQNRYTLDSGLISHISVTDGTIYYLKNSHLYALDLIP